MAHADDLAALYPITPVPCAETGCQGSIGVTSAAARNGCGDLRDLKCRSHDGSSTKGKKGR